MRRTSQRVSVASSCLLAAALFSAPPSASADESLSCSVLPAATIDVTQLPEGTDVEACGLIGSQVDAGPLAVAIPAPGESVELTVSTNGSIADAASVELRVSVEGVLSYDIDGSAPASGLPAAGPAANGCDDNYLGATKYKYLRSVWKFYVGDGGLPAAGTAAQLASAIEAAGVTWSTENSPCFAVDRSRAPDVNYGGRTTTEADISESGGDTVCTSRDGTSTIDAGNLDGGTVAANCTWVNDDTGTVLESDIRFNTTDFDFTYTPGTNCSNDYDVRSVLTHEIGHTYGMKDKEAGSSVYQTMYYQSFPCRWFARDLGRSDILHLRAHYPW